MGRHPQILASGSYAPQRIVTNAEVDALMDESTSEWRVSCAADNAPSGYVSGYVCRGRRTILPRFYWG